MISSVKYAEEGGIRCPYCKSMDIRLKPLDRAENEDGKVYRKVTCVECGETWREVYALKGYIT